MVEAGGVCTATHDAGGGTVVAPVLTSTATTPVTFVCDVESGPRESQAVRLAESVRRWGGTFSTCPFFAVMPRRGVALRPATRSAFDALEVAYIHEPVPEPYAWYKPMAKLNALELAEAYATTDTMVWLDTDTLLMAEAPGFRLPDGEGFAACAASSQGGTTGPDDPNEAWWAAMCEAVDLSIEDLPWVNTLIDRRRVRLCFNSGVFAYRRSSGFYREYHDCLRRILDVGVISRRTGTRFIEQSALSLAVIRLGLRYRDWPEPYNFHIAPGLERLDCTESMREARVLHYHNAMRPEAWPQLLAILSEARPPVAQWLSSFGPIRETRLGHPRDLLRGVVQAYRKLRTRWYERARARRL